MTAFLDLQTQTIFGRFKDAQRDPYVKAWINTRYTRLWTAFEWRFRYPEPVAVSVVAGNRRLGPTGSAIPLPADFGTVMPGGLMDAQGRFLVELSPDRFNQQYLYSYTLGQADVPEAYCMVDKYVLLGPAPQSDGTMYLTHKRRLVHDDGTGLAVAGKMVADTDKPYWPDEHHEVLIVGAQALGLKLVGDPTWQALELQHDDLVAGMIADGLLLSENPAIRKWGADPL